MIAAGNGRIEPPPARSRRHRRRHGENAEGRPVGADLQAYRGARSLVRPFADDAGAHMQDAGRTARTDPAAGRDSDAGPRHVVDLVRLVLAGEPRPDFRAVQFPPFELERTEADPLTGGRAARPQRLPCSAETAPRRAEESDEPQPLDARIVGGAQV